MTPGERFDLDEVLRFGDPWHGLWRNGVIELPGSMTRAREGSPADGSSFVVKIPGQPAATTPEEDAAQGMTWLNYGIIVGESHSLYQRYLDTQLIANLAWIFIDEDGVPWRAVLSGSTGALTVTLHRFGLFDTPEETYSETFAFSLQWGSGPSDHQLFISDIDSAGRQVALIYTAAGNVRVVERVFVLTLAASGASFTVDLSDETPDPLVDSASGAFEDHDPRCLWVKTDGTDVSGPYPADQQGNPIGFEFEEGHSYQIARIAPILDHYWNSATYVIGATMIDDAVSLVFGETLTETVGNTTAGDPADFFDAEYFNGQLNVYFPPYYREETVTETYTTSFNGVDTEVSGEWGSEFWFRPPFDQESAPEEYYWTADSARHVLQPVVSGHAEPFDPEDLYGGYSWYPPSFAGGALVHARLANRVYVVGLNYPTGAVRNFSVCGPNDSVVSDSWEADSAIAFAAANPVTGDMVSGSVPLCFV